VWGHAVLDARLGGHHLNYPLVATPVTIDYDAETTTVSVAPVGPARLQPDALAGLDQRRVADFLDLGGPVTSSTSTVGRRRAPRLRRARHAPPRPRSGRARAGRPGAQLAVLVDTGVLFVRPRQRNGPPLPGTDA